MYIVYNVCIMCVYCVYVEYLYVLLSCRCEGIEHFLLPLAKTLPDMDLMINVFDHPQVTGSLEHVCNHSNSSL